MRLRRSDLLLLQDQFDKLTVNLFSIDCASRGHLIFAPGLLPHVVCLVYLFPHVFLCSAPTMPTFARKIFTYPDPCLHVIYGVRRRRDDSRHWLTAQKICYPFFLGMFWPAMVWLCPRFCAKARWNSGRHTRLSGSGSASPFQSTSSRSGPPRYVHSTSTVPV